MAVYGIGLVLKLIEYASGLEAQLEEANGTSSFRPRVSPDPTIRRLLESENLDRENRQFSMSELREFGKKLPKKKRKASAYNKRYSRAFKKLAPKFKKKNGSWKKNGFKNCAKAARKEAKK
jgi:hypothetical protein